jgi:hypothetical protein
VRSHSQTIIWNLPYNPTSTTTMKAAPISPNACSKRPHLFRIAPELRNRIYHYCLSTEKIIIVDANSFEEPALLRTCRQIRKEASNIFKSNAFCLPMTALAYPAPTSHWIHNAGIRKYGVVFTKSTGRDIWENLLDWLKRYHEGSSHRWNCPDQFGIQSIFERAFDIVDVMKGGEKDWGIVQGVLEIWRRTVNDGENRTWTRRRSWSSL